MPLALEKMGVNITSTSSSAVIVCSWINISAFFTASIMIIMIIFSYYYLIALLPSAAPAVILLCPYVVYRISSYIKHQCMNYVRIVSCDCWIYDLSECHLYALNPELWTCAFLSLGSQAPKGWSCSTLLSNKVPQSQRIGVRALGLNITWLFYWLKTRLILQMDMNISGCDSWLAVYSSLIHFLMVPASYAWIRSMAWVF